jgi:AcrR family transcriptional regulator
MTKDVKPTSRRDIKAAATRRRVLESAKSLFLRNGYEGTTIFAIAEDADVAVQTVYAIFGNKRTVLTEMLDVLVVGDDDYRPLVEMDEWKAMEREPDSRRQLALLAGTATRIGSRMAAVYEMVSAAAASDGEIAAIYQRQRESRYRDQRRVAELLAAKGSLRRGLSADKAADIIWAIANPAMYRALVGERKWSIGDYEQWLSDMLARALLPEEGNRIAPA